jgi:phosphate transport system protein
MAEHTSKQFDAELESVRSRVLQMGGLVEEQITRAMESLIAGDMELIDRVIADDHRVNALEVGLDEMCSHIIARRQPAAGDLRLLIPVIKTITDLERIGDEAAKIARMAKLIHSADRLNMPRMDLSRVADRALAMLRQSLDAFARLDVPEAMRVVKQDQAVDDEFRAIMRQLITFMMEDPRTITRSSDSSSPAVERITAIMRRTWPSTSCTWWKGRDVRHVAIERSKEKSGVVSPKTPKPLSSKERAIDPQRSR